MCGRPFPVRFVHAGGKRAPLLGPSPRRRRRRPRISTRTAATTPPTATTRSEPSLDHNSPFPPLDRRLVRCHQRPTPRTFVPKSTKCYRDVKLILFQGGANPSVSVWPLTLCKYNNLKRGETESTMWQEYWSFLMVTGSVDETKTRTRSTFMDTYLHSLIAGTCCHAATVKIIWNIVN